MTAETHKPVSTHRDSSIRGGYIEAIGRRKTSIARVRLVPAKATSLSINNKDFQNYFFTAEMKNSVMAVFNDVPAKFAVTVKLSGGGINSQAEALRHGIARALVMSDSDLRTKLKSKGYLKRDPRAKERRKFGLKKARKAPKWSKR